MGFISPHFQSEAQHQAVSATERVAETAYQGPHFHSETQRQAVSAAERVAETA